MFVFEQETEDTLNLMDDIHDTMLINSSISAQCLFLALTAGCVIVSGYWPFYVGEGVGVIVLLFFHAFMCSKYDTSWFDTSRHNKKKRVICAWLQNNIIQPLHITTAAVNQFIDQRVFIPWVRAFLKKKCLNESQVRVKWLTKQTNKYSPENGEVEWK